MILEIHIVEHDFGGKFFRSEELANTIRSFSHGEDKWQFKLVFRQTDGNYIMNFKYHEHTGPFFLQRTSTF